MIGTISVAFVPSASSTARFAGSAAEVSYRIGSPRENLATSSGRSRKACQSGVPIVGVIPSATHSTVMREMTVPSGPVSHT